MSFKSANAINYRLATLMLRCKDDWSVAPMCSLSGSSHAEGLNMLADAVVDMQRDLSVRILPTPLIAKLLAYVLDYEAMPARNICNDSWPSMRCRAVLGNLLKTIDTHPLVQELAGKKDVLNAALDLNLADGIFSCRANRDLRLANLMLSHIMPVISLLRSEAKSGEVTAETVDKVENCFGILKEANKDFLANVRTIDTPFDVDAFHAHWQVADYNNAITVVTHVILLPVGLPPAPSSLRAQCEWSKQILAVSQLAKDEKIAREAAEQEAAELEAQRATEVAVAASADLPMNDSSWQDDTYYAYDLDINYPLVNVNGTPMLPGGYIDVTGNVYGDDNSFSGGFD